MAENLSVYVVPANYRDCADFNDIVINYMHIVKVDDFYYIIGGNDEENDIKAYYVILGKYQYYPTAKTVYNMCLSYNEQSSTFIFPPENFDEKPYPLRIEEYIKTSD